MLETRQERVKLLKAGIDSKTIEKLYLLKGNFKVLRVPVLYEKDEMDDMASQTST